MLPLPYILRGPATSRQRTPLLAQAVRPIRPSSRRPPPLLLGFPHATAISIIGIMCANKALNCASVLSSLALTHLLQAINTPDAGRDAGHLHITQHVMPPDWKIMHRISVTGQDWVTSSDLGLCTISSSLRQLRVLSVVLDSMSQLRSSFASCG